ncbi:hypothetical protein [Streptomyces sp. NPDC059080]|uniref:hypothetical protein n=1 Tax=Streptomyces sp. NPDC059080 TaxID=3346718 RepID=UPI0036BF8EF8
MSRRQRHGWIALTAAACFLTACSANDPSPTGDSASSSEQAQKAGTEPGASDKPQALPARKSDGSLLVQIPNCAIYAQKAHGQIRWYTTGGSKECEAWITNNTPGDSIKGEHLVDTTGPYRSEWFPVRSGDEVCGRNGEGQMACATGE